MKLLENILVADDFTSSSENVLDHAIELAKVLESRVSLIHVLPEDIEQEKVKALLEDMARQKLETTASRIVEAGVEFGESVLVTGIPHDQVARAADAGKVNVVLTGSGEKQRDDRFQLGTTAERIIQQCEQPVFVVKEGTPLRVKRILCPVDFSRTSKRALKNAVTLARRFGADLLILNVVEVPGLGFLGGGVDFDREKNGRQARQKEKFDKFLRDLQLGDFPWKPVRRTGDPARIILEEIADQSVDLLVMGTTGKTGFSRWMMGSVAEKVSREVPCSFVMIKGGDMFQLRLETRLQDLESHFQTAKQLAADGFFPEAIEEYKKCLTINNMHVPAYYGIARVYEEMGEPQQAGVYREYGKDILDRIWDQKIEEEIRRNFSK